MRTSTGASFYYTTDALGSIILLTDSAQAAAATYAFDSWGQTTVATGAQAAVNPWTYAGGYNDTSSNRIKFGARYYNPFRGRFTQPDPSGQEANAYLYADSNPINRADPSGLFDSIDGISGVLGAFVGAFAGGLVGLAVAGPVGAAAGIAVGGCVAGIVSSGSENSLRGQGPLSGGEALGSCAFGVINRVLGG